MFYCEKNPKISFRPEHKSTPLKCYSHLHYDGQMVTLEPEIRGRSGV